MTWNTECFVSLVIILNQVIYAISSKRWIFVEHTVCQYRLFRLKEVQLRK